jgi:transcription elongation factor
MLGEAVFISPDEYDDLFSSATAPGHIKLPSFVRMHRSKLYAGDLAFLTEEPGLIDSIRLLFVPRLPLGDKVKGRFTAALFSANAARAVDGVESVTSGKMTDSYRYKDKIFIQGLQARKFRFSQTKSVTIETHPRLEELSLFYSSGYARDYVKKYISLAMKRRWRAGQRLLISDGQLKGIPCTLTNIDTVKDLVWVVGGLITQELELPLSSVEQRLLVGDSVIVVVGDDVGRHGLIAKVQDDLREIVVVEDGTRKEVRFHELSRC